MFDIGAVELLVVAVVAVIVVRPKDLPTMLRTIGQYVGKLRAMAREFQNQFEEAARDTGIDDIKNSISSVHDLSPGNQVKKAFNSINEEVESVKTEAKKPVAAATPKKGAGKAAARKPAAKKTTAAKKPAAKKPAAQKKPAPKKPAVKKTAAPSKAATDG